LKLTRRTVLQAAVGGAAATALPDLAWGKADPLPLTRLAEKIEAAMERYAIPGVGLGVWYGGKEYVRGFGVTNVDDPSPVTGDTVFRIGSTSKTFTGTALMRLVERGLLRLDRPVRHYLPDFRTADPSVGPRVTVRQLLNHTAGWQGDYFEDTGQADDALAKYVTGMARLPQLTPPGKVFAYNNAAISLSGRLIEVVTGQTYESAVRRLVVDPLGLNHSRFFIDELAGFSVAASHNVVDGKAVVEPSFYPMPRALHPAGGLISSARDQIRFARFHLGDGTVPGSGTRLLDRRSLAAMQSCPGPGGTLFVELDGVGVTWMLRPTTEGPTVVQHGGDWAGQHSGFLMVPERDFAITVLTNSEGGPALTAELFADDWALRQFAHVSNLPAIPRPLSPAQLAEYEGSYTAEQIGLDSEPAALTLDGTVAARLAFYRRDYVLMLTAAGEPDHTRANFVRDPAGEVRWLRLGGRLWRRGPSTTHTTRETPLRNRLPGPPLPR
jgi:CubicO group peptidase (beta-lactamase class C family)